MRLISILLISFTSLVSCTSEIPSQPMCRVDQDHYENVSANAACVIRVGKNILALTHRTSGKFDLPGGTSDGEQESAQCTAHRETWEETGFNVEVGQFLGSNANGFRFYACTLDDDFGGEFVSFPVPGWANIEVKTIQLINPFVTTPNEWRFPDQLIKIRGMFNQIQPAPDNAE